MRGYKESHHNPNRIRYGWRISHSGHHMVDGFAREIIIEILIMRKSGFSFKKIKESLEGKNHPSPRNSTWHCGTIRNIATLNSSSLSQRTAENY